MCLLFLFFFPALLFAQGSPYDFIGFGEPEITQSPRMEGIAGAGTANTDSRTINDLNPAAWSLLTRARIEARLGFTYLRSDLASDEEIKRTVKFGGAAFATPLWNQNAIAFSIGFSPLTNAETEVQSTSDSTTVLTTREGGISQLSLGLSARFFSALNIGARADFLFGNIRDIIQATLSQDASAQPGVFQREFSMSGDRGTFGFLLTLDSLLPKLHGLAIGGSYSMATNLNSKKRTIVTSTATSLDTTLEESGYGYFPSIIRLGIAGRFGDRYRVEADISGQDFTNSFVYAPTKDFTGDPQLGPSNRVSLGLERLPLMGEESRGYTFWEKVGLRIGATYATLPFKPDPNTTVTETALTGGLGMPMNPESVFDFSVSLGLRTPSNTAVAPKDFFFKLGASISLSEKWFVPLRREED